MSKESVDLFCSLGQVEFDNTNWLAAIHQFEKSLEYLNQFSLLHRDINYFMLQDNLARKLRDCCRHIGVENYDQKNYVEAMNALEKAWQWGDKIPVKLRSLNDLAVQAKISKASFEALAEEKYREKKWNESIISFKKSLEYIIQIPTALLDDHDFTSLANLSRKIPNYFLKIANENIERQNFLDAKQNCQKAIRYLDKISQIRPDDIDMAVQARISCCLARCLGGENTAKQHYLEAIESLQKALLCIKGIPNLNDEDFNIQANIIRSIRTNLLNHAAVNYNNRDFVVSIRCNMEVLELHHQIAIELRKPTDLQVDDLVFKNLIMALNSQLMKILDHAPIGFDSFRQGGFFNTETYQPDREKISHFLHHVKNDSMGANIDFRSCVSQLFEWLRDAISISLTPLVDYYVEGDKKTFLLNDQLNDLKKNTLSRARFDEDPNLLRSLGSRIILLESKREKLTTQLQAQAIQLVEQETQLLELQKLVTQLEQKNEQGTSNKRTNSSSQVSNFYNAHPKKIKIIDSQEGSEVHTAQGSSSKSYHIQKRG